MRFASTALLLFAGLAGGQSPFPALSYHPVPDWPQLPAGWNFQETAGIAADARGHVYVLHRGAHPLMEFDPSGKFVRAIGEGLYDRAHAVRVDREGNIWTADDGSHTVVKMDARGRVQMVFGRWRSSSATASGRPYSGLGGAMKGMRDEDLAKFNRPTDVAIALNGDIYVSDGYGNSRVVKFDKEGRFVKTWGKKGTGIGEFDTPHSIVVDPRGRVLVADRENYRIQIFDAEGNFLNQWTHVGAPWGLAIAGQNIYMCDGYNSRVVRLDLEGKVLGAFGTQGKLPGQFNYAHQIATGPNGEIYTAEILNWRAQKFVAK